MKKNTIEDSRVGDPLPEGYIPFRVYKDYLRRDIASNPHLSLVGTSGAAGVRRWTGPVCVEKYYGDVEPIIEVDGPKRYVIWQPILRQDVPLGWHRSHVQMNAKITGFVDMQAATEMTQNWSSHAKRHLKHWLARCQEWEVVQLSLEEFLRAYMACGLSSSVKSLHKKVLTEKTRAHGELLHFFGLKRYTTGSIDAGFVGLDVPELNQCVHIASFILAKTKHDPVGVGLIHEWFKDAERRGIRWLDFDLFHGPHDPKAWEGFSRFKAQFGTQFIRYPDPLTRWTGTWKEWWAHI